MSQQKEDPITYLYRDSFPDFARMIRRMGGSLEETKDAFHDALLIYMEKEKAGKLTSTPRPRPISWVRRRSAGYMHGAKGLHLLYPMDSKRQSWKMRPRKKGSKACWTRSYEAAGNVCSC